MWQPSKEPLQGSTYHQTEYDGTQMPMDLAGDRL